MSYVGLTLLSVVGVPFPHLFSLLPPLEQVLLEPTAEIFLVFLATFEVIAPVVLVLVLPVLFFFLSISSSLSYFLSNVDLS